MISRDLKNYYNALLAAHRSATLSFEEARRDFQAVSLAEWKSF